MVHHLRDLHDFRKLPEIKHRIRDLIQEINRAAAHKPQVAPYVAASRGFAVKNEYLLGELQQILEAQTLERTQYYIQRLIKGLSEVRTNRVNDLNLNRWKEYDDIWTDSLWLVPRRDRSGSHRADYWGNFIPQIPNQLLRRFTKAGDWVLDPFMGSGTTLIESRRLGRNALGVELQAEIAQKTRERLHKEGQNGLGCRLETLVADCTALDYEEVLKTYGIPNFQLAVLHPPYWDIIQFSERPEDLSNTTSLPDFLQKIGELAQKIRPVLAKGRHLALVISDKYEKGEWIPLGFRSMQVVQESGYMLKSIVVKNFEDTRGKMNQQALWRYRALQGGFYVFKHEYIFLFQKK